MRLFKDANLNLRRFNSGPKVSYDICDEVGIIVQDDFSLEVRALSMDDVNLAANLIAEVKVDGITGTGGQLTVHGKQLLRKWMVFLHNHPSVCLLTAGNEIGFHGKEKQLADYLDGHDYQNTDMGYMDCTKPMGEFALRHWTRIYGAIDKPLLLGECGAYQSEMTLRVMIC